MALFVCPVPKVTTATNICIFYGWKHNMLQPNNPRQNEQDAVKVRYGTTSFQILDLSLTMKEKTMDICSFTVNYEAYGQMFKK